jgi:Phosphatidylinositol-specific phospholipase C, X domain
MICTVLGIGLFIGGHHENVDKNRLSLFFNLAKVHVTKKNLKSLLEAHVLDETDIKMEEVKKICLLILKKPEFRGVFLEYAGRYGGKELAEVMDYSEFKSFYREKNKEVVEKGFFNEMLNQLKNPQTFFQLP